MNLGWLGWVENNQIPVLRDMGLQIWWIGGGATGSTCCGVRKDCAGPNSPEAQWCNTSDCEACVNRVDVKTAPRRPQQSEISGSDVVMKGETYGMCRQRTGPTAGVGRVSRDGMRVMLSGL